MKRVAFYWLSLVIFLILIAPAAIAAKDFPSAGSTYSDSKNMVSILNFMRSNIPQTTCPSATAPCDLRATASRTKGKVDLSWRYTGRFFRGFFLVERSTDRKLWSVVSACKKSPTTSTTSYSCSNTGLTSGKTYYYRTCAITSGSKCGIINLTPVASVRVP